MKERLMRFGAMVLCSLTIATTVLPSAVYCEDNGAAAVSEVVASSGTTQSGVVTASDTPKSSGNELTEKLTSAGNSFFNDLVNIYWVAASISFIILLISVLFSHNDRTLPMRLKALGIILCTSIALFLWQSGIFVKTIEAIFK